MPKHFVWGDWRSDEELQEIAQEMNRPRTGINFEKFASDLRRAANAADAIKSAYEIIEKAKARNPRGLVF